MTARVLDVLVCARGRGGHYSCSFQQIGTLKSVHTATHATRAQVYDFMFDKEHGKWVPWMETIESKKIAPEAEYSTIIVSTVSVCCVFLKLCVYVCVCVYLCVSACQERHLPVVC